MTDKAELKRIIENSSVRVLLVGDVHLRDNPPRNCTESYTDDILDLLRYMAKLEKAVKANAVVIAGDMFDIKAPSKNSHRLVLKTLDVAKQFKRLMILPGNHDVSGDRLETIDDQQPLGVLYAAGVERLEGWVKDLPILGIPWQQDWNAEGKLEEVFQPWRERIQGNRGMSSSLVVTHASIFPPRLYSEIMYDSLRPTDIAEAMGNVGSLYYGHIHDYHGIFEVDGVTFDNPGGISRGSLTESNRERPVMASLWTPEHGFFEIELPHKPSSEVFLIERAMELKDKKVSDERFLEDVGSTRLQVSSTAAVASYIRDLDEETVSKEVKKVAIELLEEQNA